MTSERYKSLACWWNQHPLALNALLMANRILTLVGYVSYPLLLVLLVLHSPDLLPAQILVPGVGFILVSVLRKMVNEQRPYESMDIEPLIKKNTKGKSFPSRHVFSMFAISFAWSCWCIPVGIVLMICGCFMAAVRVIGGVHHERDVIAGAVLALVFAVIGYCLVVPYWQSVL